MKHTCPCCGHRTHDQPVGGSMQICPVCFWEDAPGEAPWNSSNGVSLLEAQTNYLNLGACEREFIDIVRSPACGEEPHPGWLTIKGHANAALQRIESSFAEVTLGDGMTIHQREVVDDYGSREEFDAARHLDNEQRWQDIPDSKIEKFGTSLTFLDPESIRYHLPAFMRHVLRNWIETKNINNEMVLYALDGGPEPSGYHSESFSLLTPEQKFATADFLQLITMVDNTYARYAQRGLSRGWAKWLEAKIHPEPNEQRN
jgi:hypothetical protein